MQNDLTSKIPFRENIRHLKNLLAAVHGLDRSYFFLNILRLLTDTANGALRLVLSADILELLYEGRPMEEIMKSVVLLLVFPSLLTLASSVLWNEFISPRKENIIRIYNGNFAAKFQSMDYSLLESPYVKELMERIDRANIWGAGISDVFWKSDGIIYQILNIICSAVVALPILNTMVHSRNPWFWMGLVMLVLLLVGLTRLYSKTNAALQETILSDFTKKFPIELRKKYVSFTWYWVGRCMGGDYHFIKDIHLYDGYEMMKKYTSDNIRESENAMHWARTSEKMSRKCGMIQGFTQRLMTLAGYLISGAFCILGAISVGNVVKFAGALTNIIMGFQRMEEQYKDLCLTARREAYTLKMFRINDEMYKGQLPVEKRLDNKYEVEFRNVSFRYPGTDSYALKHFSLKLTVGERMAIVGMNGSGKTTMIKLLCRLYDPQEGEILLNGVDIRKFRQDEYIRLFSVVFQDFRLLSMPLGQNVAASMETDGGRAMEVLAQAGLSERMEQMPEGLDTWLYQEIQDEGVEISGGEAQKIAIARALYKDAPFVLLDEPTASLDPLSEYEIYSRFDTMVQNKTAIYISHRLSSCRFCNDIAVFHEGRLVQRGSHEELLKDEKGKYYELWHAQAQYYVTENGEG